MASMNLGRVGFVLRGTWTSGTTYNPLDVVLYNGTSYAAKTTSTNLAPSAASAAWQELTQVASAVSSGIANSAVRYDAAQNLSGSQKAQAQANMGVSDAIAGMAVRYDTAQSLTDAQKSQARDNIDIDETIAGMAVRYNAVQNLTDTQKLQARENIDAGAGRVAYDESQTLTGTEQATALQNIGAAQIFATDSSGSNTGMFIRY